MDIIIAISILFMIAEHTYEACSASFSIPDLFPVAFPSLIAIPVLASMLGFIVANHRRLTIRSLLEQAFFSCCLGILINVIRAFLPVIYEADLKSAVIKRLPVLFELNFCFYIAVFLLFFALLHNSQHKTILCGAGILLSFLIIAVTPDARELGLDFLPLSMWGYMMGLQFKSNQDPETFCVRNSLIFINILAAVTCFWYVTRFSHALLFTVWSMTFVSFWVSALALLNLFYIKRPLHWAKFTFTHAMALYCSHWVILGFLSPWFAITHTIYDYLFLLLLVTGLTYGLAYLLERLKILFFSRKEERSSIKSA